MTSSKAKVIAFNTNDAGLNDVCKLLQGVIEVLPIKDWERAKQTMQNDDSVIAVLV